MNRHERRKAQKLLRLGNRALKLRCLGCDRASSAVTKEHFFPRWLINYADVRRHGITWPRKTGYDWVDNESVNPEKATIPLCAECNQSFGSALEGPVAEIFRALDREDGLSDSEAELLVRWLWKFEGLQWGLFRDPNTQNYTRLFTLRERVVGPTAFNQIREDLILAVALARANDPGHEDWPMGLDTPVGENAITMSGVFRRVALIVSLKQFEDEIHPAFGKYSFGPPPNDRAVKMFFPPCTFLTARKAVTVTQECSLPLSALHDRFGQQMRDRQAKEEGATRLILPDQPRIYLPPG